MIYDFFLHRIWKDFSRKIKKKEFLKNLNSKNIDYDREGILLNTEAIFSGNLSPDDPEKLLNIEKIELKILTIFKFENTSDQHLVLSNIIENRLIQHLECFGPFEVNNINPSVIVNANSSEVLIFKFSNQIKNVFARDLPRLSEEIDIRESTLSNPEEYYGQDPYEFMTKLYSVQPSRTYPCVAFEVDLQGLLINCQEYEEVMGGRVNAELRSNYKDGVGGWVATGYTIEGCQFEGVTPPSYSSDVYMQNIYFGKDRYQIPVSNFKYDQECSQAKNQQQKSQYSDFCKIKILMQNTREVVTHNTKNRLDNSSSNKKSENGHEKDLNHHNFVTDKNE